MSERVPHHDHVLPVTPRKSLTLLSLRDTDGDRRSMSKCKLHVSGPIKRFLCTSLIHK
ncbi:uncharacterized protein B0T23DRAFT_377811 [Neurospora hispaniola]|uniref:Uncharacterized protein n=1 Tax=Neurospora hispaniola TaxID=588809 RepID=A0AAJ0MT20_9PEZI|nr:hypothetical protein B0T23DRAFT_377811 [Neurospora hispaniola]